MNDQNAPIFTYETKDRFTIGIDESGCVTTLTNHDESIVIRTLDFEDIVAGFWWVKQEQEYHAKFGDTPFGLKYERDELKQRVEELEQRCRIAESTLAATTGMELTR